MATVTTPTVVTVLKADISGSTALAERLDPEELRSVLGTYFAALAREIQRRQGAIDKYVGDAVIAVFGLPDARADDAARAVRAAVAMQEAIERENAALERTYGARLACRIGVATGEVTVASVAEDIQAAFTVLGEPVSIAEKLEAAAPLGTVLVSERTREAADLMFRWEAARRVDVKGWSTPLSAYRVIGVERTGAGDEGRAAADVAGHERDGGASLQVATERADMLREQRKIVTVLFADMSTSSPLGTSLDPPQLRSVLGAYFGMIAREIQRYGGTIDKYVGDAVMAVFGAPISHEDDAARATAAALAIQRAARPLNATLEDRHSVRLSIRIGINTGEVVAGLLPGEVHAYTVTGDAVNTAQRIESAAPADQVLVSESTRALARGSFVYEEVAPLILKGKKEPVPAFRVLGRERRASPRSGVSLVGRSEELERLFALFREANAGRGQIAHLYGEAGVGKTRLVGELLAGLPREVPKLRARASSHEETTPYAVVGGLVRVAFGLDGTEDEAGARELVAAGIGILDETLRSGATDVVLEILGYTVRSKLDPQGKRQLAIALVAAIVASRAREATPIVVLEDLHWTDPTSAQVLTEAVPLLSRLRCVLLTTARDAASARWPATHVELPPFDPAAARELLDRLAPAPLDERARAAILDRAAGNPFFIEEIAHSLGRGGALALPATVQDLLEARIDALAPAPRTVAQGAAVIGRTFWRRVLERVVPEEDVPNALAALRTERFTQQIAISPEETWGFRHALVQEVVYGTQLVVERRRAHGTVGAAIESLFADRAEEFTDTLAFHYDRSDDDDSALTWLVRAGDRARRLFANDEALTAYRAALRRARDGEGERDAGTILERISDIQRLTGKFDEGIASLMEAQRRIPAPRRDTAARLVRKIGQAHRWRAQYADALARYDMARSLVGGEESAELAWILAARAETEWRRGEYEEARRVIGQAVEIAERVGDDEILAVSLNQQGIIALWSGNYEDAIEYWWRSLPAFQRRESLYDIATVRANIAVAYRRLGRYDEALAEQRAALLIRERLGSPWATGSSHHNIAEVHRSRGELDQALEAYDRSLELWEPIGYASGVAKSIMLRGATKVLKGDVEPGEADLREAERRLLAMDSKADLPDLYRYFATAALARGSADDAQRHAERSLDLARGSRNQEAVTTRVLGEIALARGDVARAREFLEESRRGLIETKELSELPRTEELLRTLPG